MLEESIHLETRSRERATFVPLITTFVQELPRDHRLPLMLFKCCTAKTQGLSAPEGFASSQHHLPETKPLTHMPLETLKLYPNHSKQQPIRDQLMGAKWRYLLTAWD